MKSTGFAASGPLPVVVRSFLTMVKANTRKTLLATYQFARTHGIEFNLAAFDPSYPHSTTISSDRDHMQRLFQYGFGVVLTSARLLSHNLREPGDQDGIELIRAAAERGVKLTRQMLAVSRKQRLEPQEVDLNSKIAGMNDLLIATLGGTVPLQTALTADLWPALVDPTQIELVILNLALKFVDGEHNILFRHRGNDDSALSTPRPLGFVRLVKVKRLLSAPPVKQQPYALPPWRMPRRPLA